MLHISINHILFSHCFVCLVCLYGTLVLQCDAFLYLCFYPCFQKNQKKAAEEAKKNNLMALIKERKMKKKLSPLCPPPSKKMREHILSDTFSEADDNDDDDDGGVVPQKLFEDAKQKQRLYLKKFNDVSLQLQETRNK